MYARRHSFRTLVSLALAATLALTGIGAVPASAAGTSVSGTVFAPDGTTAVAGATVTAVDRGTGATVDSATTDATGAYSLEAPGGDAYRFTAEPPAANPSGWAAITDVLYVGLTAETGVDFVLRQGSVSGTVVAADGVTPVAGATVRATQDGFPIDETTTSAADGSFVLVTDPGDFELFADPPAENPEGLVASAPVPVTVDGSLVSGVELGLRSPNVTGLVRGSDATTPAPGVDVRAYDLVADDWVDGMEGRSASTGAYGLLLDAGQYRLVATPAPDSTLGVASSITVTVPDVGTLADQHISLRAPNVTGVVRDAAGDPVEGAQVAASATSAVGEPLDANYDETGADGTYQLWLPAGDYDVAFQPPFLAIGEPMPTSSPLTVTDPSVVSTLDGVLPDANVSGHVFAPDGTTPVDFADVAAFPVVGGTSLDQSNAGSWLTNEAGEYQLYLDPGTYDLVARPPYGTTEPWSAVVRRITVTAGVALAAEDLVLDARAAPAYALERVSVGPDGGEADAGSGGAQLSGDGLTVAFWSDATNLVAGDTNSGRDVFVRDRAAGVTELVSRSSAGAAGDAASDHPSLSSGGRYVAFSSAATNLVAGDTNGAGDVFVRDLQSSTTEIVSVPAIGEADGESTMPAISGDGRYVAFISSATNLVDGETNTFQQVYLADRQSGTVRRLSAGGDLSQAWWPSISADGSTVAWTESVGGGVDTQTGMILRYWRNGTITDIDEIEESGSRFDLGPASISGDGTRIAYSKWVGDTPATAWLHDVDTATSTEIDLLGDAAVADPGAEGPAISGDGGTVGFLAAPAARFPGDGEPTGFWAQDVSSGTFARADDTLAPGGPDGWAERGVLSRDATSVAFGSDASNLVDGDTNGYHDVFVGVRGDDTAPVWPVPAELTASGIAASALTLSWPAATDDGGVTGYRIYRGAELVATVSGTTRTFDVTGLTPDTEYTFTVEAGDGAGNWTTDGPSATVTTTPAGDGAVAFLSASLTASGGVKLTWEASSVASDTGYRIRRAVGDGALGTLTTVTGTTYTDENVAAETSYRYIVDRLDAAGTAEPHTGEVTITTRALAARALEWATTRTASGEAVLGGDLALTLLADPGRDATVAVTHLSWYDGSTLLASPAPTTDTVELTEDAGSPGTYRGTFTLTEGVAAVTALTGAVADGAGHTATVSASRLPLHVAGAIEAVVDSPPGSIVGGRLTVTSDTTGDGGQRAVSGGEVVTTGGLSAATDYRARIVDGDGRVSGSATGIVVRAGRTTQTVLEPRVPATLRVKVTDDEGTPLSGVAAIALHAGSGQFAGTATTGPDGITDAITGLGRFDELSISVNPGSLPVERDVTLVHEMTAGDNLLEVVLPRLPTVTVTGTVTTSRGQSAAGAGVVVSQLVDGMGYSFHAAVGSDGRYTVEALAGPATFASTYGGEQGGTWDVALVAPGPQTVDLELVLPTAYPISVDVFTRSPGEDWIGPIPFSPGLATAFQIHPSTPTGAIRYSFVEVDGSQRLVAFGQPGQQVDVCGDGERTGFAPGRQCASVTLADGQPLSAELRFETTAAMRGQAVTPDGARWFGGMGVVLHRVTATGLIAVRSSYTASSSINVPVPEAGDYRLSLNSAAGTATVDVTVAAGEVVELGDVVLRSQSWFGSGENRLSALRSDVPPGDVVAFRAGLQNTGGSGAGDASLELRLAPHTTLQAGSVTVDGEVVDATVADGAATVPLGTVGPGATRAVQFRLLVAGDAPAGAVITPSAMVRFTGDGGAREEGVRGAPAYVEGVTLEAARQVDVHSIVVSGRAPAGSTVDVYDGDMVTGRAVASEGGFWRLRITLADLGNPRWYSLQGRVDATGEISPPVAVLYDARRPVLEQVVVSQPGSGKSYAWDPRQGVARFPFVINPHYEMRVELTFDHPERVSDAVVRIGGTRLTAALDGATWVTQGEVTEWGEIALIVDSIPEPLPAEPAPTEEELRLRLPAPISAYETVAAEETAPEAGTASIDLPGGGSATGSYELVRGIDYVPTAADIEAERVSGLPVWGLEYTVTTDETGGTRLVVSAYVPEDALPAEAAAVPFVSAATSTSPSTMSSASMTTRSLQAAAVGAARVVKVAFEAATKGNDLNQAVSSPDKYERIGNVAESIGKCEGADRAAVERLLERSERLLDNAAGVDKTGAILNIAGVAVGAVTGGAGAVAGAVAGALIGRVLDDSIARQTARLEKDAAALDCAPPDEGDEVGDPVWIFDPSGYAYEAVPSNRLDGVTATVLHAPSPDGPWLPWDAEWFGQSNPQTTDVDGRYGWDVPEGWWQVAFEKPGYEMAFSDVLEVLPPHFDVNVGLVALADPAVTGATATPSGIDVTFDRYMRPVTVNGKIVVADGGGNRIDGTVAPTGAEGGAGGEDLSRTFRFTPDSPLSEGAVLTVTTDDLVESYSGRTMVADDVRTVTVTSGGTDGGGSGGDGGGGTGGGTGGGEGGGGEGGGAVVTQPVPGDGGVTLPTASGTVAVTFTGVTRPGEVSATGHADAPPAAPGLTLLTPWFDLQTTAGFGRAQVCLPYRPAAAAEAGLATEDLALFHRGDDGRWHDVTTSHDVAGAVMCGEVSSFSPFAVGATDTRRIGGVDRYDTAARLSRAAFGGGAPVAFVASGEAFPDALAAGPVAATLGGPVLLTRPGSLPDTTLAELRRLAPTRVVVAGGAAAVSDAVLAAIDAAVAGRVERVGGADRYETAARLSQAVFGDADVVYLATGLTFPDALAAGPAAARDGGPVLLVGRDGVPASVTAELRRLRPDRIVVLGGTAAVGDGVVDATRTLAGSVRRLAGGDRYATAAAVADTFAVPSAAFVATGEVFADALAAAPAAASDGAAIVLASAATLPGATAAALGRLAPPAITVVGGRAGVSRAVEVEAAATMR